MTSSLSGAVSDDEEINVDSGHEDGEDEVDEDSCGVDSVGECSPPVSVSVSLPFSISRLLGDTISLSPRDRDGDIAPPDSIASLYSHHLKAPQLLYAPGAGVIRVPAHRPPPPPPLGAFPWLPLDPSLVHRSAASAFASQVIKERLSGQS